jgi:DNA-binding beta-propeller fold protein YncE
LCQTAIAVWQATPPGGQLHGPTGVALDGAGDAYVVDYQDNQVKKYDASGNFLLAWGGLGAGNGQFNQPIGVAVDTSGNVYVTDAGNRRVQKFDSSGNWLANSSVTLSYPTGVYVDASGNVYLSDVSLGQVEELDSSLNTVNQFTGFSQPWGLSQDAAGDFYVGNYSGTVGQYDGSFNFITNVAGTFSSPVGVAGDVWGNLYTVDRGANEVQEWAANDVTETAGLENSFGTGPGSGPGQFNMPYGLAVAPTGNVYVADFNNNRIQVFDSQGNFLFQFGNYPATPMAFLGPYAVAVDNAGSVYVADSGHSQVEKFTTTGTFIWATGTAGTGNGLFSAGIAGLAASTNTVYVGDYGNGYVQSLDAATGAFLASWGTPSGAGSGSFGSGGGPWGVGLDGAGNLWVSDTANKLMQQFSPANTFLTQFGPLANGPAGVAVSPATGNVFVCDPSGNKVRECTPSGTVLHTINATGSGFLSGPTGVTFDSSGDIYVVEAGASRVDKYDANRNFLKSWGCGQGSALDQMNQPYGVAVDSATGDVFVADTFNNRVMVFGP